MVGYFSSTGRQASREIQSGRLQLKDIEQRLSQILLPHYRSVIESFANRFMFTKQENQWERIIRNYIATQGGDKITRISGTTRRRINKIISDGQVEGLGVDRIARNIRTQMSEPFTRYRSALIARTETHNASSYTNQAVAESYEVPMKKRWVSTNDDRTRSHHSAMNGVEVDLEADFEVPYKGVTYKMKHAGDPRGGPANVINCRCVILYVEPDDFVIDEDIPQDQPLPTAKPQKPEPVAQAVVLNVASFFKQPKKSKFLDDNFSKDEHIEKYNNQLSERTTAIQKAVIGKLSNPSEMTIERDRRGGNRGYYNKVSNRLVAHHVHEHMEADGRIRQRNTLIHEYGHLVDYRGHYEKDGDRTKKYWSSKSVAFRLAFNQDKKALGLDARGEKLKKTLTELRDSFFVETVKVRELGSGKTAITKYRLWRNDGQNALSDIVDALVRGRFFDEYDGTWGHGRRYYRKRKGQDIEYAEAFANLFSLLGAGGEGLREARRLFPNMLKAVEDRLEELANADF